MGTRLKSENLLGKRRKLGGGDLCTSIFIDNQKADNPDRTIDIICTDGRIAVHMDLLFYFSSFAKGLVENHNSLDPTISLSDVKLSVAEKTFRLFYQGYTLANSESENEEIHKLLEILQVDLESISVDDASYQDSEKSITLKHHFGIKNKSPVTPVHKVAKTPTRNSSSINGGISSSHRVVMFEPVITRSIGKRKMPETTSCKALPLRSESVQSQRAPNAVPQLEESQLRKSIRRPSTSAGHRISGESLQQKEVVRSKYISADNSDDRNKKIERAKSKQAENGPAQYQESDLRQSRRQPSPSGHRMSRESQQQKEVVRNEKPEQVVCGQVTTSEPEGTTKVPAASTLKPRPRKKRRVIDYYRKRKRNRKTIRKRLIKKPEENPSLSHESSKPNLKGGRPEKLLNKWAKKNKATRVNRKADNPGIKVPNDEDDNDSHTSVERAVDNSDLNTSNVENGSCSNIECADANKDHPTCFRKTKAIVPTPRAPRPEERPAGNSAATSEPTSSRKATTSESEVLIFQKVLPSSLIPTPRAPRKIAVPKRTSESLLKDVLVKRAREVAGPHLRNNNGGDISKKRDGSQNKHQTPTKRCKIDTVPLTRRSSRISSSFRSPGCSKRLQPVLPVKGDYSLRSKVPKKAPVISTMIPLPLRLRSVVENPVSEDNQVSLNTKIPQGVSNIVPGKNDNLHAHTGVQNMLNNASGGESPKDVPSPLNSLATGKTNEVSSKATMGDSNIKCFLCPVKFLTENVLSGSRENLRQPEELVTLETEKATTSKENSQEQGKSLSTSRSLSEDDKGVPKSKIKIKVRCAPEIRKYFKRYKMAFTERKLPKEVIVERSSKCLKKQVNDLEIGSEVLEGADSAKEKSVSELNQQVVEIFDQMSSESCKDATNIVENEKLSSTAIIPSLEEISGLSLLPISTEVDQTEGDKILDVQALVVVDTGVLDEVDSAAVVEPESLEPSQSEKDATDLEQLERLELAPAESLLKENNTTCLSPGTEVGVGEESLPEEEPVLDGHRQMIEKEASSELPNTEIEFCCPDCGMSYGNPDSLKYHFCEYL